MAAALLMLVGITLAAVWYAGDRARLRADAHNRGREAHDALDVAETNLKSLRAQLDDPLRVYELLSDIDRWQSMVEEPRQHWHRAVAAVGNESLVAEETRDRIKAVDAAVAREEAAHELARNMDEIAVEALTTFDKRRLSQLMAVAEYERFFSQQGLDVRELDTAKFASAIQSSPARFALIAALDNWALLANDINYPQVARLLELTRAADPDHWRDRFRDPAVWSDREALVQLANEVDVVKQSPTVLVSLGYWLGSRGVHSAALFQRALLSHPRDFWLHLNAARLVPDAGDRIGLAHATLAIRPRNAVAHGIVAYNLWVYRGDWATALIAAKQAIEISPNYAVAHNTLGLALRGKKDLPAAAAAFSRAAEIDTGYSAPYWNLGSVALLQGDVRAAADAYRKAAEREDTTSGPWQFGGYLREDLKRQSAAVAAFEAAIEFNPRDFLLRYILGEILQDQDRYAESEQAYLGAIQAQPASVLAYDGLGRLLGTCPDDNVRDGKRAVEYATTACERTGWQNPQYLNTLAAAYAEARQFDEAVRYQNRALEDPELRDDLRRAAMQRLELFRQNRPFRENTP
jgi:tetratricopeptide (TPR) repeat protein